MESTTLPHALTSFLAELPEDIGWNIFFYVGLVMVTVLIAFALAKRGITNRVFVGVPALVMEHIVLFIDSICVSVIGSHGRKYSGLLAALWSYVFVSNLFGLILNFTPTAIWSLNLSLALITMVFVQWEGMRANGIFGHLKHFAGPKLVGVLVLISVLLFFIEITSETMKLMSLSLRLYGNIHGGHELVSNLNSLIKIPIGDRAIFLPVGGILLPLKLMTATLQAYIFVILTATYLSLVTAHGSHDEDEHHEATLSGPVTA